MILKKHTNCRMLVRFLFCLRGISFVLHKELHALHVIHGDVASGVTPNSYSKYHIPKIFYINLKNLWKFTLSASNPAWKELSVI